MILWVLIVAFNGQVRWQNERYVMPAVAWLLVAVALGVVGVFRKYDEAANARPSRPNAAIAVLVGALLVQIVGVLTRPVGEPPSFRVSWLLALLGGAVFYAALSREACTRRARRAVLALRLRPPDPEDAGSEVVLRTRLPRNIRNQHLTLGKYLAELKPNRVLVGDAGAILYESDRPGLDIIGLGGYHGMPFARAGVHGLPATVELLERMPPRERPGGPRHLPDLVGLAPAVVRRRGPAALPGRGERDLRWLRARGLPRRLAPAEHRRPHPQDAGRRRRGADRGRRLGPRERARRRLRLRQARQRLDGHARPARPGESDERPLRRRHRDQPRDEASASRCEERSEGVPATS